jgi:hypothetical protein
MVSSAKAEAAKVRRNAMRETLLKLWSRLSRLWRRDAEPQDPYAGVRVPLKRDPQGRHAAVALLEPDGSKPIRAWGRRTS